MSGNSLTVRSVPNFVGEWLVRCAGFSQLHSDSALLKRPGLVGALALYTPVVMGEFTALTGLEVEQVWVWRSFLRLVFDLGAPGEPDVFIDLTDFRFTDAAGRDWDVRIEDDPLTAGPVLGLLNRRVTTAQVRDWELTLAFDTDARSSARHNCGGVDVHGRRRRAGSVASPPGPCS